MLITSGMLHEIRGLCQADVVILAGAICDFRLDYGRSLSRKSKIITVNRNPVSLAQNSGAGREAV